MLTSLKINDIAIIEEAVIEYDSGLNAMTGETGSGKSIVIDSINAVLGQRTSKELIRDGADEARVTAVFENINESAMKILSQYEIECPDRTLYIQRTIRENRNVCKINGQTVTVSILKSVGDHLINIHGQNENQTLLNSDNHMKFIDSIAENAAVYSSYKEKYALLKAINKQLKQLRQVESDKEIKLETLEFQIGEIESANIRVEELDELLKKRASLQNIEKIREALLSASVALGGDGREVAGALSQLSTLLDVLTTLSEYSKQANEYKLSVNESIINLQDCADYIASEIETYAAEDIDVDAVESRIDLIHRLMKKYGGSEENVLAYLEKIKSEYDEISFSTEKIEKLSAQYDEALDELIKIGNELTNSRISAGQKFSAAIKKELAFLDMPNVDFVVKVDQRAATSTGFDDVEFLISANPGQEPKPIAKIASGGELSRIMLAIKCVLTDIDSVDTLIFDEIDSGVSGRAAEKIGYKLKEVSKYSQVICVTHLAQIACFADNHLYIEKKTDAAKTHTSVRKLNFEEQTQEIARIIGGSLITEATLESAREMLKRAEKISS